MTTHILVTGASRGIGAAIVQRLTEKDVRIIGAGSADGDLADPETPARLWASALDRLDGQIDILINNAGIFEANPLESADWTANWNRTMQVNLSASAALLMYEVVRQRGAEKGRGEREQGRKRFLNTLSPLHPCSPAAITTILAEEHSTPVIPNRHPQRDAAEDDRCRAGEICSPPMSCARPCTSNIWAHPAFRTGSQSRASLPW